MTDLSQLGSRLLFDLSRMLQTFVGPLELGLFVGGILGLALPARGAAYSRKQVGILGGIVFLVFPISLVLDLVYGRSAYCNQASRGGLADPVYDYLIVLSLTAAFGLGRVIRGERLASVLTALAILFGFGWLVATFLMLGMCGRAP